jgi:hypothetical protein
VRPDLWRQTKRAVCRARWARAAKGGEAVWRVRRVRSMRRRGALGVWRAQWERRARGEAAAPAWQSLGGTRP